MTLQEITFLLLNKFNNKFTYFKELKQRKTSKIKFPFSYNFFETTIAINL